MTEPFNECVVDTPCEVCATIARDQSELWDHILREDRKKFGGVKP